MCTIKILRDVPLLLDALKNMYQENYVVTVHREHTTVFFGHNVKQRHRHGLQELTNITARVPITVAK